MTTSVPDNLPPRRNPYPEGTVGHAMLDMGNTIAELAQKVIGVPEPDYRARRLRVAAFILWPIVAITLSHTVLSGWTPSGWAAVGLLGATFGASRCVAKEKVGGPIRDALDGTPFRELIGCPRCLGVWVALALVTAVNVAPMTAWPLVWVLAIAGANLTAQDIHGRIDQ